MGCLGADYRRKTCLRSKLQNGLLEKHDSSTRTNVLTTCVLCKCEEAAAQPLPALALEKIDYFQMQTLFSPWCGSA